MSDRGTGRLHVAASLYGEGRTMVMTHVRAMGVVFAVVMVGVLCDLGQGPSTFLATIAGCLTIAAGKKD